MHHHVETQRDKHDKRKGSIEAVILQASLRERETPTQRDRHDKCKGSVEVFILQASLRDRERDRERDMINVRDPLTFSSSRLH